MDKVRHALFLMGVDQTRVTGQMEVKDGEAVDFDSLLAFLLSFKVVYLIHSSKALMMNSSSSV